MPASCPPVVVIGAGPYGLSIAAHLAAAGVPHRIFGAPMRTWRAGMPAGMRLKSDGFASSLSDPQDRYTLAAYCAEQGIAYADTDWGVPVEVFAAYGETFQRRFVPHLETQDVRSLRPAPHGFDVALADGTVVAAARVVLATGLHLFANLPPMFSGLPEGLVSHSADAADLRHLAGQDVVVIGGGASALDVAASLYRAGARATVVARRDTLRFFPPKPKRRFEVLRAPRTPLGPGWKKLMCARAPLLFRRLPARLRIDLVRNHLGPAPAYSVKETVETHVRLLKSARIVSAAPGGKGVHLTVAVGGGTETLDADHVIAATGFRIDLAHLRYLDPALRDRIRCLDGAPILSSRFETSVPGLFMVGTPSAATFGPLLRFVCGAGFAARRLTGAFRGLRAPSPPVPAAAAPLRGAPRLAFLTLTNDIGSDRLVSELARQGAACAVVGAPDSYASAPSRVTERFPLPRRGGALVARAVLRARLERMAAEWAPDRIIPLDDLAARVLRRLVAGGRISPALRAVILASTGDPAAYALSCSRTDLLTAAAAHGVRVPATYRVPDRAQARAAAAVLGFPAVLKREETCGSGGVSLVGDPAALARAHARALWHVRVKRGVSAVLGQVSGEAEAGGRSAGDRLGLQAFVPGRLAMCTLACREGRVLRSLSLAAEAQHPATIGASTILGPIDHPEMESAARTMAGLLRLSGFVSFDFLIDRDGRAFMIEMNPRPIGSTHLGALFGRDLCAAYLADLQGRPIPESRPAGQGPVALFPRELIRDPSGRRLAEPGLLHDVPEDEPAVIDRYLAHLGRVHPGHAAGFAALAIRTGAVGEPVPETVETVPLRAAG